jgi:D-tyrosyl-tRNA(Tyr) deacylase
MRLVIQRVTTANVTVNNSVVSQIASGLLVLAGIDKNDTEADMIYSAQKISNLKIFPNEKETFSSSIMDLKQPALVISQFTLLAQTSKGSKPSFSKAASRDEAEKLFSYFLEELASLGVEVQTGVFGAHMQVNSINDGPVTLLIDSKST